MLNEPALKDWLRKGSEDKTKARLPLVMKLEFSSSDRSAITDHVKGMKDLEELRKVSSFFLPQKKRKISEILPHKSVLWRLQSRHLPQQFNRRWTLILIYPML